MTDVIHEHDCPGPETEHEREAMLCAAICWYHMACEPMREGDFKVCYECSHVYRTPVELQMVYLDSAAEDDEAPATISVPPADEIPFCPLCVHDF